jgi:hypothetical protein
MHGEFLRLLFLQAHRETEAHFTAAEISSQRNYPDSFRFKRAAFYQSLKSKVRLAAAKAAALRIYLNVEGCVIVAPSARSLSRVEMATPWLTYARAQDMRTGARRAVEQTLFGRR